MGSIRESYPHLPVLHSTTPPKPQPFPAGSLVLLRVCPQGSPGCVRGMRRGRVVVHWPDLNYLGKHRPDALVGAVAL